MRKTLFLVMAIVLMPFALASVSNVAITGDDLVARGTIIYILPERVVSGTLTFTVAPGIDTLITELSGLDQRRTQEYVRQFNVALCPNRVCSVPVTLFVKQGSSSLSWRSGVPGTALTTNALSIQVDTTAPQFTSFGTPTCTQNCPISTGVPTTLTAYFTEAGTGMNAASVGVLLDGQLYTASTCGYTACNISVTIPSSLVVDGKVTVTLASAADKSGNVATGSLSGTYTIDNDAPRIVSVVANTGAGIAGNVVTKAFALEVTVEDNSPVTVIADVSSLSDQTNAAALPLSCNNMNPRKCTVQVIPAEGISGGHTITITATDAAGLSAAPSSIVVRVLEEADGNLKTSWTARGEIRPGTMDLGVAKLFSQRLFITNTDIRAADYGLEVAAVRIDRCTFSSGGKTIQLPMGTPSVIGKASDPTFMLPFNPLGDALIAAGNNLDIECILAITAIKGGEIYKNPQTAKLKASIKLKDNPELPVRIEKMQLDAKEKADKWATNANSLRGTYGALSTMCAIATVPLTIEKASRIVQTALGTNPVTAPAAQAANRNGNIVELLNLKRVTGEFGSPFCNQLMCAQDWNGARTGSNGAIAGTLDATERGINAVMTPNIKKFGLNDSSWNDIAGYGTGNGDAQRSFMNPYKSLPIAVTQMCVPAIISHVESYAQIQCDYSRCLNTEVTIGAPISACEAEKSMQTCRYIGQGIFWTSPMAVFQTMRDNIISILNNPLSIGFAAGVNVCKIYDTPPQPPPKGFCRIPWIIKESIEVSAQVQQIQQNAQFMKKFGKGCEALGPPLKDDFYNTNSNSATASCNPAYCQAGDVEDGKFIARGNPSSPTYLQVVTDPRTKKTTLEPITERQVPSSTRRELGAGLQRAAQATAGVQPITIGTKALPRVSTVAGTTATVAAPNTAVTPPTAASTPSPAQSAAPNAGNPADASTVVAPSPATPVTVAAGRILRGSIPPILPDNTRVTPRPSSNPSTGTSPLPLTPVSSTPSSGVVKYTAQPGQQGYNARTNSLTMALPTDFTFAPTRNDYFGTSKTSVRLPIKPGTDVTAVNFGNAYVISFTNDVGLPSTITVLRDGSSQRTFAYPDKGTANVYSYDASGKETSPPLIGVPIVPAPATPAPATPKTAVPAVPGTDGNPAGTSGAKPAGGTSGAAPGPGTGSGIKATTPTPAPDYAALLSGHRNRLSVIEKFDPLTELADAVKYATVADANYVDAGLPTLPSISFEKQQAYRDAIRSAEAVIADPKATAAQKDAALQSLNVAADAVIAEHNNNVDSTSAAATSAVLAGRKENSQRTLQQTTKFQLTYAVKNALAFQGFVSSNPWLNKNIKPGFGLYNLERDLKWSDAEENLIGSVCMNRDASTRDGAVAGFTSSHRVGLALSGFKTQAYSDELIAFVQELESTDWEELGVSPPVLPDVSNNGYTYVISGMINTEPKDTTERGEFTITLKGSGADTEVQAGTYEYGRPSPLAQSVVLESEDEFDQVCVELSDDIKSILANTKESGNSYCVKLRE